MHIIYANYGHNQGKEVRNCIMAPFFCVVDFITVSGGGQSMEDSTQLDQLTWSNLWDIPTVNVCITLHF